MNGPEHYQKAEELLQAARYDMMAGDAEGNVREHDQQVARAQVHATLALAAATVNAGNLNGRSNKVENSRAWDEIMSAHVEKR